MNRSRSARPRILLPFGVPLVLAAACQQSSTSAGPPDSRDPPRARFLAPADGDTVAGLVRVRATVGAPAPRRLFLRAGKERADTLLPPEWECAWPAFAVARPVRVRLALESDPPAVSPLDTSGVVVIPNRPPALAVERPRSTRWLERSEGAALSASAADPEEGALSADRIRWSGTRLRRTLVGPVLPLAILAEADQETRVEARDRWGATTELTIPLRPFHYSGAGSPLECVEDLACAVRALDGKRFEVLLDRRFAFVPCSDQAESAGWPAVWERTEFLRIASEWLRSPGLGWTEWDYGAQVQARWSGGDTLLAWVVLDPSRLRAERSPPGAAAALAGEARRDLGALASRSILVAGTHELLLGQVLPGPWRVRLWRERSDPASTSLAAELAEGAGWGPPRPGAGCAGGPARPARKPPPAGPAGRSSPGPPGPLDAGRAGR